MRNLALGLAVAGLFWGCGSKTSSGGAGKAAGAARRVIKPADTLVTALGMAKAPGVPVQVKFDVRDRPDVGQPVDIDLVIVPKSAAVDRIYGRVETDEGLELLEGGQIGASERPAEGAEIHHSIKVRPTRSGVFTFSALLNVDAGGQSLTGTFAMPLIAGSGTPDQPGKPVPPASAGARAPAAPAPAGAAAAATPGAATAAAAAAAAPTPTTRTTTAAAH